MIRIESTKTELVLACLVIVSLCYCCYLVGLRQSETYRNDVMGQCTDFGRCVWIAVPVRD